MIKTANAVSVGVNPLGREVVYMDRAMYEKFYPKIYNYIYYRVLHKEMAEDLTGDVFYKALAFRSSFDERKASYKTWLYTIARNIVVNHYRSRKNELQSDDFEELAVSNDVEDIFGANEDFRRLYELLETLPEREREVIALRYWGELSYKEIAARTGLNENSIGPIINRSIISLRKLWQ